MEMKVKVWDNVTSQWITMFEVDAEEALRFAPARYSLQGNKPIPRKTPGGRGY